MTTMKITRDGVTLDLSEYLSEKDKTSNELKEPAKPEKNSMTNRMDKALDRRKRSSVEKPTPKKSSAQKLSEFLSQKDGEK